LRQAETFDLWSQQDVSVCCHTRQHTLDGGEDGRIHLHTKTDNRSGLP
jgi:hypothetical protein